jgi:Flp pilus assembly protein TadG
MWIKRGRQVERGQSAVEFALLVTVLLMFLMAILDLGRGLYAYTAITAAAQEGVRYALIHPGDGAGVAAVVRSHAIGLDPARMTSALFEPQPDIVSVTVTYDFVLITPLIGDLVGSEGVLRLQVAAATGPYW